MEKKAQEKVTSTEAATSLSRRAVLVGGAGMAGALALGVVAAAPATAAQQDGWRWCNRCQCLFYSDNYTSGWCCRGRPQLAG